LKEKDRHQTKPALSLLLLKIGAKRGVISLDQTSIVLLTSIVVFQITPFIGSADTNMSQGNNPASTFSATTSYTVCTCDNFSLDGALGLVCSTCHCTPRPSQVVDAQVRRDVRVAAANNERDQVNDQYNAALAQLEVARVTIAQLRDAAISQQRHMYQDAVRAYENAAADRDRVMDQRDAVMSKLSAANARIKNLEQQRLLLLLDLRSLSIPDSS
jgi:hypothetical protein